jgi:hypothetical protein
MTSTPSIKGSCLCGGIEFEVTGTPRGATHCHCSRCRKSRGTGHATNLIVALDALHFLKGEELLSKYRVPEAKFFAHWFCKECGSTLPRHDEARGFAVVPMGSFDEDPGVRPERHIHVASKMPWDLITDDLPQFEAAPPAI